MLVHRSILRTPSLNQHGPPRSVQLETVQPCRAAAPLAPPQPGLRTRSGSHYDPDRGRRGLFLRHKPPRIPDWMRSLTCHRLRNGIKRALTCSTLYNENIQIFRVLAAATASCPRL